MIMLILWINHIRFSHSYLNNNLISIYQFLIKNHFINWFGIFFGLLILDEILFINLFRTLIKFLLLPILLEYFNLYLKYLFD